MFSITHQQINGFSTIVLTEDATGTKAIIVPQCGAMLHGFEIEQRGISLNVMDHYAGIDDYRKNQAFKGFKSGKLSPFVCRLKKGEYKFDGRDYKIEKFYLGKHALHGVIYDADFTMMHAQADEEKAVVQMKYAYRGEDSGYPFYFDCVVTYELSFDNYLTINTTIINKHHGEIPICDGWHPYFTFGKKIDHLQLEFQSLTKLEFDDELIPTGGSKPYKDFGGLTVIGDTKFDDCFELDFAECQPMLVFRDSEAKLQIEIYPGKSYRYLQLFTPDDRQSLAVENLSSAPDAFNNGIGLTILKPAEEKDFRTTYKITKI